MVRLMGGVLVDTHVYKDIHEERQRAHDLHRANSMESMPVVGAERYYILAEEFGEVAKEFNEARIAGVSVDLLALRKELVQVAAMSAAWVDAIDEHLEVADEFQ